MIKIFQNVIIPLILIFITIACAGESVDFNRLAEEKARIKAANNPDHPAGKPTPGQLIFSKTVAPTPTIQSEVKKVATPSPSPQQRKSRKSDQKKNPKQDQDEEDKRQDKENKSEDSKSKQSEEKSQSDNKNTNTKNKKKSSGSSDNSDDTEELPKRLFRPRFRAESSAESLKYSIIITLSLSLLGILII